MDTQPAPHETAPTTEVLDNLRDNSPNNFRDNPWPPLPLADWEDTKTTLHLFCQIVGKVRLALHPPLNHWWHAPLYVAETGLTTRPIPYRDRHFAVDFDFLGHDLVLRTGEGDCRAFSLQGLSVADFHRRFFGALNELNIAVEIRARPYDLPGETTPFPADAAPRAYDAEAVSRYSRALALTSGVLEAFRGRFLGKSTPVHLFWHSFDLALTRFSGRRGPEMPGANRVNREAYSHEVVSFGFWPGDRNMRAPAFYSYTYPEPANLINEPLAPAPAYWQPREKGSLALLMYEDLRQTSDPRTALLEFLESAYQAGARRAGWDVEGLTYRPAGA